ncbi:MAG: hypothetical protein D3906_15450 [Candidatus Electrothrix sp. AUS1_2]|nr:hypothetical protein [Candidatus Electrothrix sp. AUS1_2]
MFRRFLQIVVIVSRSAVSCVQARYRMLALPSLSVKTLPDETNGKFQSVRLAGNGFLFRPFNLIDADETLVFIIFFS